VQHDETKMMNNTNYTISEAIELRQEIPFISIHDQGAGGNNSKLKDNSTPN